MFMSCVATDFEDMVKLKRRYLLVETVFSGRGAGHFTESDVYRAILDQVAHLHGDFGVGSIQSSFQVKVYDSVRNILVLRIAAHSCQLVTSALPFVIGIRASTCVLRLLFEGSSMRSVERRLMKLNLDNLYAMLRAATTQGEKQRLRVAIASVTGSRIAHVRC